MYDVIIIGKGPAGISASLYIKRANLSVLVIGKGIGALEKAKTIENYYGITATGKEIAEVGIKQAEALEIPIKNEEVLSISYDENFKIETNKEKYEAKVVLLATGTNRIAPNIEGLKEFEGKGISYCAVCDGFLYRMQDVAVLGNGEYALHEAQELSNIAKSVTILTNGKKRITLQHTQKVKKHIEPESIEDGKQGINIGALQNNKITINEKQIQKFEGENIIQKVKFKDNTELPVKGIFVAEGVATSIDFARKLGAKIEQNKITVNSKMETTILGLYAAGDCTGGLLQISTAVAEGAIAGTEIIKFIRKNKEE